jgi:VWFA-related protein
MRRLLLVISLTLAAPLLAQMKAPQPPMPPSSAPAFFNETIEVRITNVDVVVSGKDGRPVTGLTKDDFILLENGVPKEITNFAEVRGTVSAPGGTPAAGAPVPAPIAVPAAEDFRPRLITIFIDNATLEPFNRNALLPSMRRFLRQTLRTGDQVMIATWASGLSLVQPLTADRAAAEAAVETLAAAPTKGSGASLDLQSFRVAINAMINAYESQVPPDKPPYSSGVGEARGYAMRISHDMRQKAEALKSVIAAMRGFSGRKAVVLVTEGFSSNPSEEAFAYLDAMKEHFTGASGANPMADSRQFDDAGLVANLSDAANAAAVTLYPIHAAGKASDLDLHDASTAPTVTAQPVILSPTGTSTLQGIANATGGVATTGTSNWELAFARISGDLASYYSLGYRASPDRVDRLNRIDVQLRRRKEAVRARQAVIETTLSTEMAEAVAANLFYPVNKNDLAIAVTAGSTTPAAAIDAVTVPLTIRIPTAGLTLAPEGSDLTGTFSVFAAFLRKDGAVSRVDRQQHRFRFPAESLKRRKEITVHLDVTADRRTDGISVGVLDELSHATGFGAVKVREAPAAPVAWRALPLRCLEDDG